MEWINRKDKMPKYGEIVFAVSEGIYELPFVGKFITNRGFVNLGTGYSQDVDYWMSIPARPEVE